MTRCAGVTHDCEPRDEGDDFGIVDVRRERGKWVLYSCVPGNEWNDERTHPIVFCPFCGERLVCP